jgi:hypothetical protein
MLPFPLDVGGKYVWETALGSAIEVAIALAGFSGIVAAVGRRGAGHWEAPEQLLLRILLTASGAALVFAFLPFLLFESFGSSLTWRVGSGLQASYFIVITARRYRQSSSLGAPVLTSRGIGVQAAVIALLVANAAWISSSSVYVFGVLWTLFTAFITFVRLLLDSWNDPSEGHPPAV